VRRNDDNLFFIRRPRSSPTTLPPYRSANRQAGIAQQFFDYRGTLRFLKADAGIS